MSNFFKFLIPITLLLVVVIVGFFTLGGKEQSQDTSQIPKELGDLFGNAGITIGDNVLIDNVFDETTSVRETSVGEKRDDRIFTLNENVSETENIIDVARVESINSLLPLVRLFAGPVAGYKLIERGDDIEIKIVERGGGDRYVINLDPYSLEKSFDGEFSKTIRAHIFENDSVLVEHEDENDETTILSSFTKFIPDSDDSVLVFENNIRATTNNGNLLFFLREINEESVGVVVDVTNPLDTRAVWNSGFTSWIPRWGRNKNILLSAPVSRYASGYAYLIDPSGLNTPRSVQNIDGGGGVFFDDISKFFVLYEQKINEFVGKTNIVIKKPNVSEIDYIEVPTTLPEKCDGFNGVFVCGFPSAVSSTTRTGEETIYPDSWYQGDLDINDSFFILDGVTGNNKLILSSEEGLYSTITGGRGVDAINPQLDSKGRYFFFQNKSDFSLWMLRI